MLYGIKDYLTIGMGLSIVALAFTIYIKNRRISALLKSLRERELMHGDLNEQTKVIIHTDLELKKTQEELDKRILSLFTLHKISRLLLTTLDREEIIKKLYPTLVLDLGFDKFLLTLEEADEIKIKHNIGFQEGSASRIPPFLKENPQIKNALYGDEEIFISEKQKRHIPFEEFVLNNFEVSFFMSLPLKSAAKELSGFCLFGRKGSFAVFDDTDIEIARLLTFQIAQSLENAQLFEEVYKSQQELHSRIKERTQQLENALEELRRISKMKSDFVSSVSHELRTPLTSIKGYANLLSQGKFGALPPHAQERIEKIDRHTDTLVDMINNLLDIARIESGREEFFIKKENLKEILKNTEELLLPQIRDKRLNLTLELPSEELFVLCDLQKMQRVLLNLLSNAIKFTPPQGRITVRAGYQGDTVSVEVADTGVGISKKNIDKIFDEFYRAENVSAAGQKGTGLGLSLVKKILEAHDSEIGVESKEDKGTRFFFTLKKAGNV